MSNALLEPPPQNGQAADGAWLSEEAYRAERGKPMPSENHAAIQMNLGVEFIRRHPELRPHGELTLNIGGKPYTPDISVYPRKPLDLAHDVSRKKEPPLTVVEIFSPQQGSQEIMDKVDVYFAHGVKSCWIVSPPLHTIQIRTATGYVAQFGHGIATDPDTGLSVDVDAVFT
ncbi:MAG: Uma2 family endonuclease [Roseimicrobium sp.]